MEAVSTGITQLDKRLGGGVPAGSVLAVDLPPTSSGELLGAMLGRRTSGSRFQPSPEALHYLSTGKRPETVSTLVEEGATTGTPAGDGGDPAPDLRVTYSNLVGVDPEYQGSQFQAAVREYRTAGTVDGADERPSLVVDGMDAVVRRFDCGDWHRFLGDIVTGVGEAGGVGYLYLYRDPSRHWTADERQVLQRCDGVVEYVEGTDVDRLVLRRLRGSRGKPVQAGGDNATGFPFEVPLAVSREVAVDATDTF